MPENSNLLKVEVATLDDLEQIVIIESAAHIKPWSEKLLQESLTNNHLFLKLMLQNKIIGYQILMPIVDELELLNIVIASDFHGMGYGRFLLKYLVDYAQQNLFSSIFLEVRESNHNAIKLYQDFAFESVGIRKNYYSKLTDNNQQTFENALIMQLSLLSQQK